MLHAISVKDYMTANPICFTPDADVLDAIHNLVKNEVSGAPVVDHLGNLVGVLTEKDCMKVALTASYHEESGGSVGEFMTTDVKTVEAETSLVDVAELFLHTPYRIFPVMEDNRLVGQIGRRDVLKALENLW